MEHEMATSELVCVSLCVAEIYKCVYSLKVFQEFVVFCDSIWGIHTIGAWPSNSLGIELIIKRYVISSNFYVEMFPMPC